MNTAIEFAKEHGAIIAECVQNPETNFHWGLFNTNGQILPTPKSFEKDAFVSALFGVRANGGTDCICMYEHARSLGCDVDIYITDLDHLAGPITSRIDAIHKKRAYPKPRAAVIVDFSYGHCTKLKDGLEAAGIPVALIRPEALKESALVAQVVKQAVKGASVVIEEIMATPLLKLPEWWEAIK